MMNLDTKFRNFRIYLKDGSIRSVTEDEARRVLKLVNTSGVRLVDLLDDEGNYDFSVDKHEIKRVERAKRETRREGLGVYCDYGEWHPLPHIPEGWCCASKYQGISPLSFWRTLKFTLGYNINYAKQITPVMKKEVLSYLNNNQQ